MSAEPGPVAIEARGIEKTFRVPEHRIDSLKERATHPFTRIEYRQLRALRDVSFDVHRGEFFGIQGRNGSGKSTLLKILASIYRADGGGVRMAGRLAPFIELGVGFNMELTARENALLNGVLLGLTKREARRRLDAILEFAELEDFVELELKNYSSGMVVRLAFAVMVQADADIMLVDEVLAVGDAAFSQKCLDVFRERRNAGKTIVLVTHDMAIVEEMCDRAMLLEDGELKFIGAPAECAAKYYRLNFELAGERPDEAERLLNAAHDERAARLLRARLVDDDGRTVQDVDQGDPLQLEVVVEARREMRRPRFVVHGLKEDGTVVFEFTVRSAENAAGGLGKGDRARLVGQIENRLVGGSYMLNCWLEYEDEAGKLAVKGMRLLHFGVSGSSTRFGLVRVDNDFAIEREP